MPRPLKDKPIGARISSEFKDKIDYYLSQRNDISSLGDLIRRALEEFIWAHPLPLPEDNHNKGEHERY